MRLRSVFLTGFVALSLTPSAFAAGRVTVLSTSDVDYLDPGRTYYTFGYQVQEAVHRTLYALRPVDPAATPESATAGVPEIVPDLAAGPPEIGDGGRTVTVHLRAGVRYAPPVDREVVARDVAYAVSRTFSDSVAGGYTAYFDDLVGAPRAPPARPRAIRGIETPDDRTVVFRLRRATGAAFAAALILPATAPVPEEYARRFDDRRDSTYGQHAAATGPYRVIADRPGRAIELARNPSWDAATDPLRPARSDAITLNTSGSDTATEARRVAAGRGLASAEIAPRSVIDAIRRSSPDRIRFFQIPETRYVPLNTTIPPLNRLHVRRAVIAALDRQALFEARGGLGVLATHFLPPGVPGFDAAGGVAGTGAAFLAKPHGDLALARAELRRAGYRTGRLRVRRPLLMVGPDVSPGRVVARRIRTELARIGLRLRLKLVPTDIAYSNYCQRPRRRVAICANAGWFSDFPDGVSLLRPVLSSGQIFTSANNNLAQLRSRAVDAALARGALLPPGAERDAAAAQADRAAMSAAAVAPYIWDIQPLFASADVTGQINPQSGAWDLSTLSASG